MFLKYFLDDTSGHASYLVGCQQTKAAIVIDPSRDTTPYVEAARRAGLKLFAVAETHIHADFVSGAHDLAARYGAKLFVSNEGTPLRKYYYLENYDHQKLKDGDSFHVGKLRFDVLHTPGHTPESISFLLTDEALETNCPMGLFSGDLILAGSIGQADLIPRGPNTTETAYSQAQDLFQSLQRCKNLPEYLQVWPSHDTRDAGIVGLDTIPSTTIGYELKANPAFRIADEKTFMHSTVIAPTGIPEFGLQITKANQEGPRLFTAETPKALEIALLAYAVRTGNFVDLRSTDAFARQHVPKSLNIPLDRLASWAGWLIDCAKPIYLLGNPTDFPDAIRILHNLGIDDCGGVSLLEEATQAGLLSESYPMASPDELAALIGSHEVRLIDVRSDGEWVQGHIPYAEHHFLGQLQKSLALIPHELPLVVQGQEEIRSAIGASILQAAGYKVINMQGGFAAWHEDGLPIIHPADDFPVDVTVSHLSTAL